MTDPLQHIQRKVTITGLSVTGKTTLGTSIAKLLNVPFFSGGLIMRKFADEHGMTIDAFASYIQQFPDFDRCVDHQLIEISHTNEFWVIESRLARLLCGEQAFNVLVICSNEEERGRRAFERDRQKHQFESPHNALEAVQRRDHVDQERYLRLYNQSDITDPSKFDLVIDTFANNQTQCVNILFDALRKRKQQVSSELLAASH